MDPDSAFVGFGDVLGTWDATAAQTARDIEHVVLAQHAEGAGHVDTHTSTGVASHDPFEIVSQAAKVGQDAMAAPLSALGSMAQLAPHLPDVVKAPIQEAGQSFGQGVQKGALQGAGAPGSWLASIPAPLQIAGGVALAVIAGAMLFAKRGR